MTIDKRLRLEMSLRELGFENVDLSPPRRSVYEFNGQSWEGAYAPLALREVVGVGTVEVLHRQVPVAIGDGRTLVARLVPYNVPATVSDGRSAYREAFAPTAFSDQLRAAHRIPVNYRHGQSIQDQVGRVASLESKRDGLHGELRIIDHPDGDKALEMVREGLLDKLSIEFTSIKSRMENGVVERVKARLLGVALTPTGAYDGAEVLAVR